jgi:AcrR family transcriptional regulator
MRIEVDPIDDPAVADAHRRGRILWALATCMTEKGYQDTTISDIARVGRVSKTVLYSHFPDKEHVLLELYSRSTDKVLDAVRWSQARAQGLPWRDRVRAVVSAYLQALASNPALAWAALVEVPAAGRTGLTWRRDVLNRYVDLLNEMVEELAGQDPYGVRPVDRSLLVGAIGGINELMLARVECGEAERLPEDAEAAAALVIGLLERRG